MTAVYATAPRIRDAPMPDLSAGSCFGHVNRGGNDLWYAPEGSQMAEAAINICQGCPVQEACLRYAIEAHETEGIWGGRCPSERNRERRRQPARNPRTPIAHGTARGEQAHRRRGEKPCEACRLAANASRVVRVKPRGTCDICGAEMLSASIRRHKRNKHEEAA